MKHCYLDKTRSPEERAENLLSLMTIEEKLDQLVLIGCNQIKE